MKLLIYDANPQLISQLLEAANNYTNLRPSLARLGANPLTLVDYNLLFIAPFINLGQTSEPSEQAKVIEFWQKQIQSLIAVSQARQAKLVAWLPLAEELTHQASKDLLAQLEAQITAQKEFFILAAGLNLPTKEAAKIILASLAQLAAGAKAWGRYTYTQQIPNPLLENFGIHPLIIEANHE